MCKSILTIVFLMCTLNSVFGLYFHIAETERKCFLEELGDDVAVIVNYKVELYDPRSNGFMPSSPTIGIHVEVRDSYDKMILSSGYNSEGRISFTSTAPGEHAICMFSNSTPRFSGSLLRVHLDIQVGEHAIDYANVAQKEKLSGKQLRIRQLLEQVEQITKEQYYQRYREQQFTDTCKSIKSRVLWWSVAQTIVLLGMGYLCRAKFAPVPFNSENTQPIKVLRETWQKMHYPPETGTIMLILRLMALYEQSNNKLEFLETLQSFRSITVNTEEKACLLDEDFENQMKELFEAFRNAFNTEEFVLFTTPDAFKSLMALIEANSQGIATSPLADWVKMLSDLPLDEKDKIQLNEYIDSLENEVVNVMFL